jgi:hypothetical protein
MHVFRWINYSKEEFSFYFETFSSIFHIFLNKKILVASFRISPFFDRCISFHESFSLKMKPIKSINIKLKFLHIQYKSYSHY